MKKKPVKQTRENWLGTFKLFENWQRKLDWTGTQPRDSSPEVSGSSPRPVKFSLPIFQIIEKNPDILIFPSFYRNVLSGMDYYQHLHSYVYIHTFAPFLHFLSRKYRHVSYRQVVRWCWGFLGRHNRVRLPSCIINKTRITYPDPDGNYKGFKLPDLDE